MKVKEINPKMYGRPIPTGAGGAGWLSSSSSFPQVLPGDSPTSMLDKVKQDSSDCGVINDSCKSICTWA
jgi:hypothetical protein